MQAELGRARKLPLWLPVLRRCRFAIRPEVINRGGNHQRPHWAICESVVVTSVSDTGLDRGYSRDRGSAVWDLSHAALLRPFAPRAPKSLAFLAFAGQSSVGATGSSLAQIRVAASGLSQTHSFVFLAVRPGPATASQRYFRIAFSCELFDLSVVLAGTRCEGFQCGQQGCECSLQLRTQCFTGGWVEVLRVAAADRPPNDLVSPRAAQTSTVLARTSA